ncbi:hypothetical protein K402DRAFT_384696 [Aulographum hederae CBS 113979]|uniref:N-acetyltransferase domain-containing protein n=1 Tax=Aulographum hederae CBS 113979 TaxID=1176131 RepID=A0A6G1GMY9_9PEZI|nr:hypothetical protein K402DRAFT_384696 [Aulographum hederae CBS 113979]
MSSSSTASNNPPIPRVRRATLEDIEGWINAQLTGFELDYQFRWRYPKRHEFPEDTRNATGAMIEGCLKVDNLTCLVAELPETYEKGNETEIEEKPVIAGVAIWEVKMIEELESEETPSSGRRDMDPARQAVFIDTLVTAEKKHFGREYGPIHLYLADLSVDPKYHRRRVGSALMQYGMDKAKEPHIPITLTCGDRARLFYLACGFRNVGFVECGVEGEDERVGTWLMYWAPEGWVKSGC